MIAWPHGTANGPTSRGGTELSRRDLSERRRASTAGLGGRHEACDGGSAGTSADDLRALLADAYKDEPFVHVAEAGVTPKTQNVRGSNHVQIGVFADRIPERVIIVSTLDNLVKGSAGQAIQNFNLMFGLGETEGLMQLPLFP